MRSDALLHDLLPPAVARRVRSPAPQFSGVYDRFGAVPDEAPWSSPFWMEHSRRKLADLTPGALPAGCYALAAYAINRLREPCDVLDFGGGTGFVYFLLRAALSEDVRWHVVDSPELASIGQAHAATGGRLAFSASIPREACDVLYVNTTAQYLSDDRAVFAELLANRPKIVVLTRLIAGDVPTWITAQDIGGRTTPCRTLNLPELLAWFAERDYRADLVSEGDSYADLYAADVPERLRIPHDVNVVLSRT